MCIDCLLNKHNDTVATYKDACDFRWAMAEGYGACLINKPELVRDMVRLVRNQVEKPNYSTSIKIR